jgi:signal transduction histidine kinase/ligand-binding sensor domain-containing protein
MFYNNLIKIRIPFVVKVCVIILFISQLCSAQEGLYHFNLIIAPDSIPLRKVTCITQDPQGYMWFADQEGGCIIRYDGYNIIRYKYNPPDPNSLGGGDFEAIFADTEGKIWFGAGNCLDEFDTKTGSFTHYRNIANDPNSFCGDHIKAIIRDREGFVWVGTVQQGLERLDVKTGKFQHYRHDPKNPNSLSCNEVWIIYEDHHSELWIGTGFPWSANNHGGLNKLDKKTGMCTRYLHDPLDSHSLVDNKVGAIFEDSRGVFWVGTRGDGLHIMDRQKGSFERHPYDPLHPSQLSRPPLKNSADIITFIQEDGAGRIWIGTNKSGISAYDPVTQKINHFQADRIFPDSAAWTAFTSRDGELWIASEPVMDEPKHLYRIDPFVKTMSYMSTPNPVSVFHEDKKGNIWMGTDGSGLALLPRNNSDSIKTIHLPKDQSHFPHENFVTSIYEDQKGVLWLGSTDGVFNYNPSTQLFTRFETDKENNDVHKNVIPSIMEDHQGLLWICSFSGLAQLDRQTGFIKHYHHDPKDSTSINSDQLFTVMEDHSHMIWISELGYEGLNRLDPNTNIFSHYLQGLHINCIYTDDSGIVWAATNKNLFRYNKSADQFTVFEMQSMIASTPINAILEDKLNNLWLNSPSAIFRIDPSRSAMRVYTKANDKNPGSALFETKEGKIFAVGDNGFYVFSSEKPEANIQAPLILLTDFYVDNKKILPGNGSAIPKPINEVSDINLSYDQNIFSLNFLAIHYSAPDENVTFYKLEGYDNDWRKQEPNKSASYFKVVPDKYVLRLKATNKYGLWSERSVRIIIHPPWWRTWWAFSVYVCLLLAIGIVFYRMQKQRIVRKEREQARERELVQAKEIEKAYHELKNTQAQLIQSEKMASLGELTAGIAHEIQNPLNFVNNFSDVNAELIDEVNQEIDKGNTSEAKIILKDIKENEQKINHHGKRADAIVKGMLQHSRSGTGVKEPTDINALADEYLRLSYHGLRAKDKSFNATLDIDFDETIGKINIIPQDIGRVLLNLYNNAFYAVAEKQKQLAAQEVTPFQKVSPLGLYEPTVSISTKKSPNQVSITVSDNGNGIPQKALDKIFQPFFTTKPTGQGTGLGLSLSYDIIKAHRGEIKVETKEGEGSEFCVVLPV